MRTKKSSDKRWLLTFLLGLGLMIALVGGIAQGSGAQTPATGTQAQSSGVTMAGGYQMPDPLTMMKHRTTDAMRKAAAERKAAQGAKIGTGGSVAKGPALAPVMNPGGTPDYFGTTPNWANSPLPILAMDASGNVVVDASGNPTVVDGTTGIRKFVDTLPGLTAAGANDLGNYLPVAVADTTTYAGSDYYVIGLVQYKEQLHRDLPATTLRGYVQIETPANVGVSKHVALFYPDGVTRIKDASGNNVLGVDKPSYLGPTIVSHRNVPTRIKFTNYLPTGSGGNLFIPVDTTDMGAGTGPLGGTEKYTAEPRHAAPARRRHSVDQRWDAASVDDSRRRDHVLSEGRQRLERPRHARSRARVVDLLLHEPAERAADVLPRPRVRYHPPERLRR